MKGRDIHGHPPKTALRSVKIRDLAADANYLMLMLLALSFRRRDLGNRLGGDMRTSFTMVKCPASVFLRSTMSTLDTACRGGFETSEGMTRSCRFCT